MLGAPSTDAPGASGVAQYLAFAAKGHNAWWRYAAALILGLVFWVVLLLVGGVALGLLGLLPADLSQQVSRPRNPAIFFTAMGASFGALLAGLLAAIALVQRKSPLDLLGAWAWPRFGAGAGLWLALMVVATLADFALAPGGFRWSAGPGTGALALSALLSLPIQTLAEEVIFRGWVTQGLLVWTRRPALTALIAGLLFGSLHIPNGVPQAVGATLFGIATSFIAIRTGGIAFTYGLHVVNNLFGAIVVVSAGDVFAGAPGLISQSTPHLMWWDVAVEAVLLAAVAWWMWTRRART